MWLVGHGVFPSWQLSILWGTGDSTESSDVGISKKMLPLLSILEYMEPDKEKFKHSPPCFTGLQNINAVRMTEIPLPSLSEVALLTSSYSRYPSLSPSSLRSFRFLPFSLVSLPPFLEVFLTFSKNVRMVTVGFSENNHTIYIFVPSTDMRWYFFQDKILTSTFARWFWNQTWTTRIVSPVSAANCSLTCTDKINM